MMPMRPLSDPYKPLSAIYLTSPFNPTNDGPKAVQCSHIYTPYAHMLSDMHTPTPPLRNLLSEGHPHGVLYTGPLSALGNNWIKAGLTVYSNCFFGIGCVKVGSAGVGEVIWGGRGV